MRMLKSLLNWVFPQKCIVCNCEIPEKAVFCINCFSKVVFIESPICKCCGKAISFATDEGMICETCLKYPREFDLCRSLLVYDNNSKKLIMKIKKQASSEVACACVRMLSTRYLDTFKGADCIIPIPSHWTRTLKNGYNQSAIIAKELSKSLKIPLQIRDLTRIKKTEYQKNKKVMERLENVNGAFRCNKDLSNRIVILVDDVLTTGATLNEAAKTLKLAGASKVLAITIAST